MVKLLVEGRPGIGKTTVVRRCVELLTASRVPVRGVTTAEMRTAGRRIGFRVEALDGEAAVLAHVEYPGPPRVGRYGVDIPAFERVALPALQEEEGAVMVIDELGKMELASDAFRACVDEIFAGRGAVLATVHRHPHPFTDALKTRPDVRLVAVTERNRDVLPSELVGTLTASG